MVTAAPKKAAPKKAAKPSVKKATVKSETPTPVKKKAAPKEQKPNSGSLRSHVECSDTGIKWTEAKKLVIQALVSLDATKANSAVTPEQIAKAGNIPVGVVLSRLDSRWDLISNQYVESAKMEDGVRYFATLKSVKIKF